MRLPTTTSSRHASVYRLPGVTEPLPPSAVPASLETVAILFWVFACALLRFGFFVARGERFGVDPAVALAALGVTLYSLCSLARLPRP